MTSDLIELSPRQNFAFWLPGGEIFRSWARSACGETAEGIADWVATGAKLVVPYYLALKAEGLHFADRSSEALEAISEAEALAERSEERCWCAELHRLRGVFLTALGAEASLCEAIRIAKEQKSVSPRAGNLRRMLQATWRTQIGGSDLIRERLISLLFWRTFTNRL